MLGDFDLRGGVFFRDKLDAGFSTDLDPSLSVVILRSILIILLLTDEDEESFLLELVPDDCRFLVSEAGCLFLLFADLSLVDESPSARAKSIRSGVFAFLRRGDCCLFGRRARRSWSGVAAGFDGGETCACFAALGVGNIPNKPIR